MFATANLGIVTGPSDLTVVDCDTPGMWREVERRFGETSVVVGTPRGGLHFWYRSAGERCTKFSVDGCSIDIKGKGGFVVAPPSVRPGTEGRKTYHFLEGGWPWNKSLPCIKEGAFHGVRPKRAEIPAKAAPPSNHGAPRDSDIGHRNDSLFRVLLPFAAGAATRDAVLAEAGRLNAQFRPPLEMEEVARIAGSVWSYRKQGKLFTSAGSQVCLPAKILERLLQADRGDTALALYALLKHIHAARVSREESFAIACKAMAEKQVIKGWTYLKYQWATELLIEIGLLNRVHVGGRGRGDPHRYVFGGSLR